MSQVLYFRDATRLASRESRHPTNSHTHSNIYTIPQITTNPYASIMTQQSTPIISHPYTSIVPQQSTPIISHPYTSIVPQQSTPIISYPYTSIVPQQSTSIIPINHMMHFAPRIQQPTPTSTPTIQSFDQPRKLATKVLPPFKIPSGSIASLTEEQIAILNAFPKIWLDFANSVCTIPRGECKGVCNLFHKARGRNQCNDCKDKDCKNNDCCGIFFVAFLKQSPKMLLTHFLEDPDCTQLHTFEEIKQGPKNLPCGHAKKVIKESVVQEISDVESENEQPDSSVSYLTVFGKKAKAKVVKSNKEQMPAKQMSEEQRKALIMFLKKDSREGYAFCIEHMMNCEISNKGKHFFPTNMHAKDFIPVITAGEWGLRALKEIGTRLSEELKFAGYQELDSNKVSIINAVLKKININELLIAFEKEKDEKKIETDKKEEHQRNKKIVQSFKRLKKKDADDILAINKENVDEIAVLDLISLWTSNKTFTERRIKMQTDNLASWLKDIAPNLISLRTNFSESFKEAFNDFDTKAKDNVSDDDKIIYQLLKAFYKKNIALLPFDEINLTQTNAIESAVDKLLPVLGSQIIQDLPWTIKDHRRGLARISKLIRSVVDNSDQITDKLYYLREILSERKQTLAELEAKLSEPSPYNLEAITTSLTNKCDEFVCIIEDKIDNLQKEIDAISRFIPTRIETREHSILVEKRDKIDTEMHMLITKSKELARFNDIASSIISADSSNKGYIKVKEMFRVTIDGNIYTLNTKDLKAFRKAFIHKQTMDIIREKCKSIRTQVKRLFEEMKCIFIPGKPSDFLNSNRKMWSLNFENLSKIVKASPETFVKLVSGQRITHHNGFGSNGIDTNIFAYATEEGIYQDDEEMHKYISQYKEDIGYRMLLSNLDKFIAYTITSGSSMDKFVEIARNLMNEYVAFYSSENMKNSAKTMIKLIEIAFAATSWNNIDIFDMQVNRLYLFLFHNMSMNVFNLIEACHQDKVSGSIDIEVSVSNMMTTQRTFSVDDIQLKEDMHPIKKYLEEKLKPVSTPPPEAITFKTTIRVDLERMTNIFNVLWDNDMILQHVGKRYYNETIYFDTAIPLQ
jgi:uncharacterized protein YeaO (DUF488 family)